MGYINDIYMRESPIFEKYPGSDSLYYDKMFDGCLVDVSDRVDTGNNSGVYWRYYKKATRID